MRSCLLIGPKRHHLFNGLKISSLQPASEPVKNQRSVGFNHRTIRILLPPVQLIIHRKGHTLLKAALGVCRPSNSVAFQLGTGGEPALGRHVSEIWTHLETQGHIKVLGHIRL